jgi:hypothetical protein
MLSSEDFVAVARQTDCSPQRRRPLIPEVVAWLMMYVSLYTTSMTQGLTLAWGCLQAAFPHLGIGCVSEEAFCQARRGLTLRFWKTLWQRLVRRYESRFDDAMRWRGRWRLLIVDGSDVNLPDIPALADFFGRPRNNRGDGSQPQGRLVALCSALTGFCIAFTFTALRFSEHTAFRRLIRHLRPDDLVLLDRGFFSLRHDLAALATASAVPHAHLGSNRGLCPNGSTVGLR